MPAKKTAKKAAKKAPAKKRVAKKAAKKVAAKKTVKKVSKTVIVAQVDVGFGNALYIRGEGGELSWDKGLPMENISPYEWAFEAKKKDGDLTYKLLINDETWAEGDNTTVAAGTKSVSSPSFIW